jgi:O-antigen/teichoic acid export membrane protein
MLKRIFTIALITGTGQVFVIFALKYISQNSSPEQVKTIGQIDSLVLFIMNVIALGLQPSAMRNLALADDWKKEYASTQSARLTLSFFIAAFALLAYIDQYYLVFLIAPLIALSGDYALYGRGLPVKGAIIAFVRSVIPFLLVLILIWKEPLSLPWLYFIGLLIAYIITNLFISLSLKTPGFPQLRFTDLKMYINTLPLGIVSLGLYFIGMGVILVAQYFYTPPVLATAFIGLKFYIIFKGVLRFIQQAFLKEMVKDHVCLKVDQLSSLLGLCFFIFMVCFPNTFINFFFGVKYLADKNYFIVIAAAALVYSLFSSFTTRAMLDRKDHLYAITTISAALLTLLVCVILSFSMNDSLSIGISIIVGELLFAAGMIRLMKRKRLLAERVLFVLKNIPFLFIPLAGVFFVGDKKIIFLISLSVFVVSVFLVHKNKFNFQEPGLI